MIIPVKLVSVIGLASNVTKANERFSKAKNAFQNSIHLVHILISLNSSESLNCFVSLKLGGQSWI